MFAINFLQYYSKHMSSSDTYISFTLYLFTKNPPCQETAKKFRATTTKGEPV